VRDRADPDDHGGTGAAARFAGRQGGVARVQGAPVQRVVTEQPQRPRRRIGPPDYYGASLLEISNSRVVFARNHVATGNDAVVGRTAGLIGVDLGRDRDAEQRAQNIPRRPRPIGCVSGSQGFVGQHARNCVDHLVHGIKAGQAQLSRLPARDPTEPDLPRQFARIQPPEIVGRHASSRCLNRPHLFLRIDPEVE